MTGHAGDPATPYELDRCPLCRLDGTERAQVDATLADPTPRGSRLRPQRIATTYGLDPATVHRHRRRHLDGSPAARAASDAYADRLADELQASIAALRVRRPN